MLTRPPSLPAPLHKAVLDTPRFEHRTMLGDRTTQPIGALTHLVA